MLTCKKTALLSVVLVFGFSGALSSRPPQTSPAPAEDQLNAGITLLTGRRYGEAIEAFARFKQAAPQDARGYFYLGMALAEVGSLAGAAAEFEEAGRLAPARLENPIYQANVLLRLKQKNRATDLLDGLEKKGDVKQLTPAWLKILADDYFRLAKTDEALRILALLSEQTPDDPDIDLNRGQIYVALGRFDLALESLQRSLRKSRQNPIANFEVGKILYARNELSSAKEALSAAVEQDKGNPKYLQKLGDACLALGETSQAIEHLKRAEASGPSFPEIYYSLGRAYQKSGERAKADEYMKEFQESTSAQREKETQTRAVERLVSDGEAQLDQGNAAEARSLFERAVQLDPENWYPRGYLAEMFLASGELELAYQNLVKMEEIEPDSVVGNYLTAQYWVARKDYERARPCAEKARFGRPGNSELRSLLGNIYRELGQKVKAREEFQAAVRLAPDRVEFREQLRKSEAGDNPAEKNPARQ